MAQRRKSGKKDPLEPPAEPVTEQAPDSAPPEGNRPMDNPPSENTSGAEPSPAQPQANGTPQEPGSPKPGSFPIVGIGASAGGLAAIEQFFSGMPSTNEIGIAFVIVQHLSPDHKSILVELVKRYTKIPVFEAVDGTHVRPNCAYVIPP